MSTINKREFIIYDSNIDKEFIIENLAEFCREKNLTEASMRDVTKGRTLQHKGYYAKDIDSNIDLKENYIIKNKPKYEYIKKNRSKQDRYNQSDEYVDFLNNIEYYYNLYHIQQKLSCNQIAILVNSNSESIRLHFRNNNLQPMNYNKTKRGNNHYNFLNLNDEQQYFLNNFEIIFPELHNNQNLSPKEIADKYNLSTTTILNYCDRLDIEYKNKNISTQHSSIINFLNEHNIEFKINCRQIIKPKELDIVITNHNVAIEINGLYWHSETKLGKRYHLDKHNDCLNKNIELLQFWDTEIIDKFNIVKSILSTKLKLNNITKIYGRNTEIRKLKYFQVSEFLENNHLQGKRSSNINYGLYHNEELVMIATFNKHKKYDYELVRMCSKLNTNIVGGAQKLMKIFINTYNPTNLVSYCDKRIFNGNVYTKLNLNYQGDSLPNYFYFNINNYKLQSRIMYQKHKLKHKLKNYDENLTEIENMKNNGYDRIFDCGNKIFTLK